MTAAASVEPTRSQVVLRAMAQAAATADYAPSILETRPWRWRVTDVQLDLGLEVDVSGPDRCRAILGCGAALNHARVSLAANGWHAQVTRMPDPADLDHLARLTLDGPGPIDPQAFHRLQTIRQRQADRRPVTGAPIGEDRLRAITTAVEAEGVLLHLLNSDLVGAPAGNAGPDQNAIVAVLYGHGDQPLDWLRAGEALSVGWLVATELDVSVQPIGPDAADPGAARRRVIGDLGQPYLVLRLGSVDPAA